MGVVAAEVPLEVGEVTAAMSLEVGVTIEGMGLTGKDPGSGREIADCGRDLTLATVGLCYTKGEKEHYYTVLGYRVPYRIFRKGGRGGFDCTGIKNKKWTALQQFNQLYFSNQAARRTKCPVGNFPIHTLHCESLAILHTETGTVR